MECQSQNPDFSYDPEHFHLCDNTVMPIKSDIDVILCLQLLS